MARASLRLLSCVVAEGGRIRSSALFSLQIPHNSARTRLSTLSAILAPSLSNTLQRTDRSTVLPWTALAHSDTLHLRHCSQQQLRARGGRFESILERKAQNHEEGKKTYCSGMPKSNALAVAGLLVGLGLSNNTSHCERVIDQEVVLRKAPTKQVYEEETTWAADVMADLKCCLMISLFTIFGPLLSLGWTMLSWTQMAVFWTVYLSTLLIPSLFSKEFQKNPYIGGRMLKEILTYLKPFTMIKEAELDPSVPYIFGYHPHGRGLPLGTAGMLSEVYRWFPEIDKAGKAVLMAGTDLLFFVPLLGIWMRAIGAIPVNRKSIVSKLREGHSVVIAIGGIDEVLAGTYDDKDVLFLESRKGFCRVAIETQSGLVPVFCFGENAMFEHSWPGTLAAWKWVNQHLARLGAPFPLVGRFGLPIMHRRPMTLVFGEPLFPRPGETPAELHGRYVQALCSLHKRHVASTAYPNKRLVIV